MPRPKHDLTGQTFGHLTVVREVEADHGPTRWLCRCPNGKEVVRLSNGLLSSKNARCGRARCACSGATSAPSAAPVVVAPAPRAELSTLDPERNRERYVRVKLQLRSFGLEPKPFAELTCSECPEAPACPHAFDSYNTDGDCLEAK